jgi:peroxiredoxin
VPETFVIDREGVIRKKWIGAEDWNSDGNKRLLEQLLAQPRS